MKTIPSVPTPKWIEAMEAAGWRGNTEETIRDFIALAPDIEKELMQITAGEVSAICDCTVRLVALRQAECKHLSIENAAPEIMQKLFVVLIVAKRLAITGCNK
jgi:hypothetical protein